MTEDQQTYTRLSPETVVSMNMWGFPASMMDCLRGGFAPFLDRTLKENPMKGEYFLPFVVNEELQAGRAKAHVYTTPDKWYGVTYHEDRAQVVSALRTMTKDGWYPAPLWPEA